MESGEIFLEESCVGSGDGEALAAGWVMVYGCACLEGDVTYSIGESFLLGLRETN
jgi:hypothetical protein